MGKHEKQHKKPKLLMKKNESCCDSTLLQQSLAVVEEGKGVTQQVGFQYSHLGCYSTRDSAKWNSDRSRLKCSSYFLSHLPSVSITFYHFRSLLSLNIFELGLFWLTRPLPPETHMQYHNWKVHSLICVVSIVPLCLQGTHPNTSSLCMLSGHQTGGLEGSCVNLQR